MKKICIISADDLSTIIFAKSFGAILKNYPDIKFYTIGMHTIYEEEIATVESTNISLDMERFISPLADLRYFFSLVNIFRREKFDIVITFTTKPNILAVPAAKLAGVPKIVVAVRGMGRVFEPATNIKSKLLQVVVSLLNKFSFRLSNFVWFTNPNDERFCVEKSILKSGKSFLTRNAINVHDFSTDSILPGTLESLRAEFGLSKDDYVVIMVARLIWSKGIREFAEAAEILKDRLPTTTFLLVAPVELGGPQSVPVSFVREMENKTKLVWVEFRKDIRDLYGLANLAVLPSYYKEGGYPRALLEPMGLGKPVIAADTPDCRAPVEHGENGFLVKPGNAVDLAERIEQIIKDPEIAIKFGRHSLDLIHKKYDDRLVARSVLEKLGVIS